MVNKKRTPKQCLDRKLLFNKIVKQHKNLKSVWQIDWRKRSAA